MIVNGWTNVLPLSHMAHAFPLPMSTFPLPNGTGTIPAIGLGTALSERHEVGNAVRILAPCMKRLQFLTHGSLVASFRCEI